MVVHPYEKISQIPKFPSSVVASIRVDGVLELSFDRSLISAEDIIDFCRKGGVYIKDIATSEPALDDVFRLAIKN